MTEQTVLYRHFAHDGSLLYVGVSLSWPTRTKAHARGSKWFADVAEVKIERFKSRDAALVAERDAIVRERPKFNVVHNRRADPEPAGPRRRPTAVERELRFRAKLNALAEENGWKGPLKHWIDSGVLDVDGQGDGLVRVLLHCATHGEHEWHWIDEHKYASGEAWGFEPGWVYSKRGSDQ